MASRRPRAGRPRPLWAAARSGRRLALWLAPLTAACVLAAACGGSAATSPGAEPSGQAQAQPADGPVIRLALPPDPLWDWLNDSGAMAGWEESNGVRVAASQAFDQFGAFAGNHADIVVINAADVPNIVQQSQREAVILGKYTFDRSFIGVGRYSTAETLADLGGTRIAVHSPVESTLLWGVITEALHDLRFRLDGGSDFELVVADPARLPDLVMRGDVDACVCLPDLSVSYLADRELKPLYEGRSAARIYADQIAAGPDPGLPFGDVFVADKAWYGQNGEAAESFLSLWSWALGEWQSNRAALVASYPHHFSVRGDEEVEWLVSYMEDNDWIAPSPYVSQGEAKTQADTFSQMKEADLIDQNTAEPEVVVSGSSGS